MEKKRGLIVILSLLIQCSTFAQLTSHVDERFELTSIVFRLADAEEYVNNEVANYAESIDTYFAPYKEHALIKFVKEIRERDEIAYDAVSSSTFILEIKKGKILLKQDVDLDAFLKEEPRWKKETLGKYIQLLNVFYKDTKFKTFYNQHQYLYAETEKRFDELLKTIHVEWFQPFYGESFGNPSIYVSLSNGRSNYALNSCTKNASDYGIIIGCSRADEESIPVFNNGFLQNGSPYFDYQIPLLIVHELSHHFANPLVDKYKQKMIEAAEKIFPYVEEQLSKAVYGYLQSILYEGFNALFTNMYFKEYPTGYEKYMVRYDEDKGFVWMRRAVQFMENFYKNRNSYPSIQYFMSQLVSFTNFCGENIEQIIFEYNHSNPYIVNVFPALNTLVSADVREIRVDFSCPMKGSYGTSLSKQPDVILPEFNRGSEYWNEDKTTFIIPVKLEKGTTYGLLIPAIPFQSSETFPMKEDFEITFSTAE
jgi:hypothetical protein